MAVQLTEPSAKRQRSSTHSALPEPGEDSCEFLAERQLILRHGTSLQLMALVGTALNESSEFEAIDPEEDWQKWQARRPDFSLYYAALVDPARDGADSVLCVLRAVLDGVPEPTPPHRSRMIIDYVTTRPVARGRGLASHLVNFVVDAATAFGANVYVLATEDSCVYWMGVGFTLESGENLNARLNIFNDTHLLRRSADPVDLGSADDLELAAQESEEEEGDAADEPEQANAAHGGEEDDLEAAIAMSLGGGAAPEAQPARHETAAADGGSGADTHTVDTGEEDADLRAAIAMSLAEQPPSQ